MYNDALKLTAAHTTERDILFEYITSVSFTGHDTATLIQAQDEALSNIKIEAEDVLNPHLFQEKKENAKSNLNKPLNFTEDDYYSFQEWLKLTPVKPLEKTVEVSKNNTQKKRLFLEQNVWRWCVSYLCKLLSCKMAINPYHFGLIY